MKPRIEIVEPQAGWPDAFAALKAAILIAIPPPHAIHHIGSTAVPRLPAKDVIDIQITVTDLAAFDDSGLVARGFVARLGLVDHAPPGRDLAGAERLKRFYKAPGRPANIHVRELGRYNQRFALLCRDFLRTHPVATAAYALIKQRLAARFPDDDDAYYDIKDPVFDIIIDGAEEWALRTGWRLPEGD
ncbi:GrpB family protein [Kaistia geumhonensis]|uniref:GrpB-like predicted nucleotidyltransferase (UPF0157 family) n=1 Tax=Kaistia geumhonensis TaxID=410839 RepID=A0ABU0MA69_9HYPH|nr:GrpB family protein [Kaistia geumhonensis]MCX5480429.1 GrpB family protein [Kaistia geumhonensis]MDQ0517871.1 GrpB-like predicted nucleotidyltransferase (UPF0157 family) [Kaistia geumhonensis]